MTNYEVIRREYSEQTQLVPECDSSSINPQTDPDNIPNSEPKNERLVQDDLFENQNDLQIEAPPEPTAPLVSPFEKISEQLSDQKQAIDAMTELIERQNTTLNALTQASARQEKANTDVLRDSKNFQATVREQTQQELDNYHKLHSAMAYAPILTELASLYITTMRALGYVANDRSRNQLNELVLDSMRDLLTDQGVILKSTPVGQARSLKTCKTRKTIPTGDQALHGKVAYSDHPSFVLGNLVLIKESVDTYVYDSSLIEPDQTENLCEIE